MSLFKKLFGKSDAHESASNQTMNFPPAKTDTELLEQYGGIALEKQTDVPAVVGNNSWQFDMNQGTIAFGQNLVFPVEVLGTFSHSSSSWLWAWANEKSGIPARLQDQVSKLKMYGETNGISLLTVPQFDGEINDMHRIGLMASGMFGASCYYIADYGQGAMLVTLQSSLFDKVEKIEHHRILTTFPQLISTFDMNHKPALRYYLQGKGYQVNESEITVTGKKGGNTITGEFDELGRLAKLQG